MTIEYVDLKGYDCKDALEHIKKTGLDKETVTYVLCNGQ